MTHTTLATTSTAPDDRGAPARRTARSIARRTAGTALRVLAGPGRRPGGRLGGRNR